MISIITASRTRAAHPQGLPGGRVQRQTTGGHPPLPESVREYPALMFMQDERHSSSDLNSRHQQTTEPSYLQTHWKPMNSHKCRTTDSDDPHTKPSQTESSWLKDHSKSKLQQSSQDLERGPCCSCCSKRSKSADPPPVKSRVCPCKSKPQSSHSRGLPCGLPPEQPKVKKGDSTRTSITESDADTTKTSYKSTVCSCTKEVLRPSTCGSVPPYWAGQSNLVSGSSYRKAKKPDSSNNTSYQSTPSQKSKRCQSTQSSTLQSSPASSESQTTIQEDSSEDQPNQSTMTWMADLKSGNVSEDCPQTIPCQKCGKQPEPSSVSVPSHLNQPSFGLDYETSATTRSRSIVDKVTRLYPPCEELPEKPKSTHSCKCTCSTDFHDDECTSQSTGYRGATSKCTCSKDFQDTECTSQSKKPLSDHSSKCTCATDFQDAECTSQSKGNGGATSKCTCSKDFQDTECTSQSKKPLSDHSSKSSCETDAQEEESSSQSTDNRGATSKCTCSKNLEDTECSSHSKTDSQDEECTSPSRNPMPDKGYSGANNKYTVPLDFKDPECTSQSRNPDQVSSGAASKCTNATDFQDAERTDPTSDQGYSAKCTCASDTESTSQDTVEPSTSANISKCVQSEPSECCIPCPAPRTIKTVNMTDCEDKFCDCKSPSTRSLTPSHTTCMERSSDPCLTSYHSHRSLPYEGCPCNEPDEPDETEEPCEPCEPCELPSNAATSCHSCQSEKGVHEDDMMCSCHTQHSGLKSREDSYISTCQTCDTRNMYSCHTQESRTKSFEPPCEACATRKQRVIRLVEELSAPSGCFCGEDRTGKIQKLFRELTMLLRSESECAVAPTEEKPCSDPLPFEECCTAQHEHAGTQVHESPLSKKELQRVECFHQLEEYLRKCFMPPAEPKVPETDIYGFELSPDFSPDAYRESSSTIKNLSSAQFYDLEGGCSGDGLDSKHLSCTTCEDDEVFHDCECGNENDDGEKPDGDLCDCESVSLCDQLKTFVEKELQEIEATAIGDVLEDKTPEVILKELCDGSTITVPMVKVETVTCDKEEKGDCCKCPFAGMEAASPWTDPNQDKPPYPYNLPIDPSVVKEPPEEPPVENRGLLPPGELPPDVRELCEKLICKALKDCGLCPTFCEDCEECDECMETPEEATPDDECPDECLSPCPQTCTPGCLCCHCRALICDDECKTVSKTLRSAMCDPLCEMKYFIDSMIIDLHAMDCVLGAKQAKPKDIRANDASRKPQESFPVTISNVTSLGCTSLFVQWEVADCRAIAGYEIYVDGHLTNRFYSFRHQAGVVTNVDVTNPHQIVLRAQAVGQEFPGEGSGRAKEDECCKAVTPANPELAAGAERPWSPSVYYYDPNAPEKEIKC
ncbi:hypothetical protein KR054_006820 [Drosophila jambulina]|nr:hypothetical protein KR054_006820 [Drosophila jambulina]